MPADDATPRHDDESAPHTDDQVTAPAASTEPDGEPARTCPSAGDSTAAGVSDGDSGDSRHTEPAQARPATANPDAAGSNKLDEGEADPAAVDLSEEELEALAVSGSIAPAMPTTPVVPEGFRSGFACFVGRPNAGKSTLTNALVGTKVAITSNRPQTTRHTIRGVVTRDDAQLILVDTPGLHRPRTLLGKRLNELVADTLSEVDVIGFCVPADQKIGPGDRYIVEQLKRTVGERTPVVAIVTKTDTVGREQVAAQLMAVAALGDFADIVPTCAIDGFQVPTLTDVLIKHLPEGPMWYPGGELTDEPEHTLIAELVREAALEDMREELPHSLAVLVEEVLPRPDRDDGMVDVHVLLFVERDSQKGIVIGKGGAQLKEIGTKARGPISKLLGCPVNLQLRVKLARDWQRDPKQLRKLGFD